MAETRSKAKAKGTEGPAPVTNSTFISTLYKKYKPPRKHSNDSDITQYFPCTKRSKTSKDLIAQSQPLPMKFNSNNITEGKEDELETKMKCKQNPISAECSSKEKGLDITSNQSKTVQEDQLNDGVFCERESINTLEFSDAIIAAESTIEEELIFTDSLEDGSAEDNSTGGPERPGTMQDIQPVDLVLSNGSRENNSSSANEKPICACSLKINRNHENLVKLSGELKNISNIIENIKRELEKYTK